jgi:hypothetical protein
MNHGSVKTRVEGGRGCFFLSLGRVLYRVGVSMGTLWTIWTKIASLETQQVVGPTSGHVQTRPVKACK